MASINKLNQLEKEIKSLKNKLGKHTELDSLLIDSKTALNSINSEASIIPQKVQDVQDNLASSNALLEQSKTVINEITAIKDTVAQGQAFIEEQKGQVSQLEVKLSESIKKVEETSLVLDEDISKVTSLREEITKQLGIITGGTLAHSFEKQKKDLVLSSRIWAVIFFIVAVIVTIVAYFSIKEIINSHLSNPVSAVLRVSILLPLTYAMILFAGAFRRSRELEEEYSFKTAVAFSIAAYQKILTELKELSTDEKVSQFLTSSIGIIYTPPKKRYWELRNRDASIVDQILKTLQELNIIKPMS